MVVYKNFMEKNTQHDCHFKWARIVLVVERGVSPTERLKQLMVYSQPMSDGRRALVLRLNQSVCNSYLVILWIIIMELFTG